MADAARSPAPMFATSRGQVVEFDAFRGLGVIESVAGQRVGFHCAEIADGTREIAVGAVVQYDLVAGRLGRTEAANIMISSDDN